MSTTPQFQSLQGLSDAVTELDTSITSVVGKLPTLSVERVAREIPEFSELRFVFVVSTLYKLYREAGGDELKFLNTKISGSQSDSIRHYELINDLRTFAQHDVQSSSGETGRRRERCRRWFAGAAVLNDSELPANEDAWNKCTKAILSEAIAYLRVLKDYVDSLHGNAADYVKKEWLLLRARSVPHGDFDRLTAEVAGDIGMESRNIPAFRNQYYERIITELRAQRFDINVAVFVKKAITARLLDEFPGPLLVAEDLKALGMKPGLELGKVLKQAQQIWIESDYQMSKGQVLARLQELAIFPQKSNIASG